MVSSRIRSLGSILGALALSGLWAGCPETVEQIECGPPIAAAGEDLTGVTGQRVILRGAFRLPPEDKIACQRKLTSIQFLWEQTAGPEVSIEGANQVEASFVPTVLGDYAFRCKATYPEAARPELAESQWDTVQVQIAPRSCGPPVAEAGEDQLLGWQGQPIAVALDGSRSHAGATCPDLEIVAHRWTVLEQPAGSDLQLVEGALAGQASFFADLPGTYRLELEVQDSLGTADGRNDTSNDTLRVVLIERTPCDAEQTVEVLSAEDSTPLANAQVLVIDAAGASHQATSAADGRASLSGLAPGRRRSINAWTGETVPALPGSLDPTPRPRRQRVSVLDHCSGQITVALPLTDSGRAAKPTGIVTAKLDQALFDRLPHSQKLAGACASDGDCNAGYACSTTPFGDLQCTPKSLLPVFGLDDPNVSGQLRGFMLMPVLARGDMTQFPVQALLAPPPTADAFLPGNMATDDAFLNGLAPALGLPVWGATCSTVANCPNSTSYACEQDEAGQRRCRDLKALHSLRLEVEAADAVGLVLLGGVVDVGMENLLPILATFLTAGGEDLTFDVGGMLGAFRLRTLHACPLTVAVQAGVENDISAQLAGLDLSQCWNVAYQQQEATVPIPDPYAIRVGNICQTDADCGWPALNERCLPADPAQPNLRHCMIPMYRVQIVSEQEVRLAPAEQALSPTTPGFDARLCDFLPASGRYQKLCPGQDSPPLACDPPQWCDAPTPAETECALPYGLAVLAADFDPGHAALPRGGRVVLGFLFNHSPFSSQLRPAFLAPALADMQAAQLQAVQMYYRNLWLMPDGRYQVLEGGTSVAALSAADTRQLALPEHASWPGMSAPPDSGLATSVTFAPSDPLAACGQTDFDRVYATATGMSTPEAGVHMLPPQLALTGVGAQGLLGVTIQRVDRGLDAMGDPVAYPDAQWRLWAPAGMLAVALPPGVNPVPAGREVWISPAAIRFGVPFDFDLFPAYLIQREQSRTAKDSYATIVP